MNKEPEPITLEAARPVSRKQQAPANNCAFVITAIVFFLLGLVVAGLIGIDLLPKEQTNDSLIAEAVDRGLIELTPTPTIPPPTPTSVPVEMTFSDDHFSQGPEDAPITLVEFSDYQCPYCIQFALVTKQQILDLYGDYIKFVHRDYPIYGDPSFMAARAATCAGEQDKFWEYDRRLFEGQAVDPFDPLDDTTFLQYATELELDEESFATCLDDDTIIDGIVTDVQEVTPWNFPGTPVFFMNGRRINGALPLELFKQIIVEELEKQGIQAPT
jgi:protein-disulfide isomerase